jgi:hypothetical protein
MKKMKICLNFGGVIANPYGIMADVSKEKFGAGISIEQFRRKTVVENNLLTWEQYQKVKREVMHELTAIPPVPGALLYLPLLLENHSVCVVTNQVEEAEFVRKWFAMHGLRDCVVFNTNHTSEAEIFKGLNVYVDDNLEKLLPLMGLVPNLLFFSGQSSEEEPECITRLFSWPELYVHIWHNIATR